MYNALLLQLWGTGNKVHFTINLLLLLYIIVIFLGYFSSAFRCHIYEFSVGLQIFGDF